MSEEAAMTADPDQRSLSPDEIRALLRECVTVVRPDEVLIVRTRHNVTTADYRNFQLFVAAFNEASGTSLKAMLMQADELAVAAEQPEITVNVHVDGGISDAEFGEKLAAALKRAGRLGYPR